MEKFGTQLIREGFISPEQLEEGIRMQSLYGGRLGSNLVELNFVHADVMADFLGRLTGFPVATQGMLDEATPEAIALIPADVAERFECMPMRKEGRRLHVAMTQPENLASTDALSFKTGLRIVPYVALEIRLKHALEQHYGIVNAERAVGLQSRAALIERARSIAPPSRAPASAPPPVAAPPPSVSAPPPSTRAPASQPPPPRASSLPPGFGEPRTPPVVAPVPQPPPQALGPCSAEEAVAILSRARTRDEIAETLLRFGAGLAESVYLFLVRDGMALGWKARGRGGEEDFIDRVMLPLNAPSIFKTVVDAQEPFAGGLPDEVLHRHFYKALRRETPSSAMLAPVIMRGRVVNLVYLDTLKTDASVALALLNGMAPHVVTAYERILKEAKEQG